jgi:hypothetical protein
LQSKQVAVAGILTGGVVTGLGVVGGDGVEHRHLAELPGLLHGRLDGEAQHVTLGLSGGERERVEGGLPPGAAAGLGHDRRDDVHELGERRGVDAVGVAQQRDEQAADDDGVRHVVPVLQQHRGHGPVVALRGPGLGALLVPDVPLVEGDVDPLVELAGGPDLVGRGGDGRDEVVHVHAAGEEGREVAVVLVVIGVGGDEVDVLIGLGEDGALPLAERGHGGAGGTADGELEARVDHPHGAGGLGGEARVLLGGLVADLPRAVHLVAEAPHLDPVGVLDAVGAALVRPERATRDVAVLEQVEGLLDAARAEIDGHHRLDAGGPGPVHELVDAERVRLG